MPISVSFDSSRPLIFMHIPKCGGTSLDQAIQRAIGFSTTKRFFGSVLHGADIGASYRSWHHNALAHAAIDDAYFLEESDYVVAHASFSELHRRHSGGQFITFLREPICRLISLRTFVRSFSDEFVSYFGTHGMALVRARLPLKDFLGHPYFAANYDNVMTRMLLHGHPLIPSADFIDASSDKELVGEALNKLRDFSFVSAVDSPAVTKDISDFLGRELTLEKENEASVVPQHLRCDLRSELDDETFNLLERHSRLDLALWNYAMGYESGSNTADHRRALIERCIDRHARLLDPGAIRPRP